MMIRSCGNDWDLVHFALCSIIVLAVEGLSYCCFKNYVIENTVVL